MQPVMLRQGANGGIEVNSVVEQLVKVTELAQGLRYLSICQIGMLDVLLNASKFTEEEKAKLFERYKQYVQEIAEKIKAASQKSKIIKGF